MDEVSEGSWGKLWKDGGASCFAGATWMTVWNTVGGLKTLQQARGHCGRLAGSVGTKGS